MPSTSSDTVGIEKLNNTVSRIWNNALSERTLATYKAGFNSFKTYLMLRNICSDVRNNSKKLRTLPERTKDVFILYIAYCFDTLHVNTVPLNCTLKKKIKKKNKKKKKKKIVLKWSPF